MSFTNLYYKRIAGTPRPCFVCYRPTPIVLATAQTVDFLYTCESHLKDPGFASRIADDPPPKPALSVEEIAQVKTDWEERRKRKTEKAKEKEGEKGKGDDKDGGKPKDDSSKDKTTKTPPKVTPPAPAPTPQQPSHEKYALHRDVFALRTAEHRRRKQTAQAKELAPRLPGAPRSAVN
ncbi:DUF1742-domain-containing protein [Thelephora ganbajun]|uniref:DUF1742-domain-containing protein n=1 Tax=Thelephora ganbajun TaxID=370292 RepID=A0ACB6ZBV7_THEGA|nr:DUF1742-domain-containing protein [Thelephora ganbajun]